MDIGTYVFKRFLKEFWYNCTLGNPLKICSILRCIQNSDLGVIFFNVKEADLKYVSPDLLKDKSHPQQCNGRVARCTLKT